MSPAPKTLHCARSQKKVPQKSVHVTWDPSEEDMTLMCATFSALTIVQWFNVDDKGAKKSRWKNKCLQKCVLNLCCGRLKRHAERLFNRRCCNEAPTGYGSFNATENLLSVTDFLQVHKLNLSILEEKEDGRCEEFILGSGEQCLGHIFWDAQSGHASMVPRDVSVECFSTEVSSQPWLRSAVGADFLSHDLPANMRLFKPSNVSPNIEPNGYIFVDSFHYKKKKNNSNIQIR